MTNSPTPEEQQHAANLQALYQSLSDAEADPQTPSSIRETLLKRIDEVQAQLEDLSEVEFHQGTVSLQAAEAGLKNSITQLKQLQKDLAGIAATTATLAKVADAVADAISSAESLGL